MEYVHGQTLETVLKKVGDNYELKEKLLAKATNAISLFVNFEVPSKAKPGLVKDISFNMFSSRTKRRQALEKHLNNVRRYPVLAFCFDSSILSSYVVDRS